MRTNHGWVRLTSDSILLGLDSYQFHFYHIARALANPPNSRNKPSLLDFPDVKMAGLLKCSRWTIHRLKQELLTMGLLTHRETEWYVNDPDIEALHNHSLAIEEISRFLQDHQGVAARLNSYPRRSGHRRPHENVAPSPIDQATNVAPSPSHVAPSPIDQATNVAPSPSHVAPSPIDESGTRYPISIEVGTKKNRRVPAQPFSGDFLSLFTDNESADLARRYQGIDLQFESRKCWTYWSESKKHLQRPKSAYLNWLERAQRYQQAASPISSRARPPGSVTNDDSLAKASARTLRQLEEQLARNKASGLL